MINPAISRLVLDVNDNDFGSTLTVTRGDVARQLRILLTCGGKPYIIGSGCYAKLTGVKADKTEIVESCVIEDNQVVYDFTESTVSSEGIVECQVVIFEKESGLQLSSAPFDIVVLPSTIDRANVANSSDFYSLLTLTEKSKALIKSIEINLKDGGFDGSNIWVTTQAFQEGKESFDVRKSNIIQNKNSTRKIKKDDIILFHGGNVGVITGTSSGFVFVSPTGVSFGTSESSKGVDGENGTNWWIVEAPYAEETSINISSLVGRSDIDVAVHDWVLFADGKVCKVNSLTDSLAEIEPVQIVLKPNAPVPGVDYFTEDDKGEMLSTLKNDAEAYIDEAILGKGGASMRVATIASNNSTTLSAAYLIPIEGRNLIVGDLILYTDGVVKVITAVSDSGNSAAVEDTGICLKGTPGEPGAPGEPGEDGYTPEIGVDYWTEEDKASIVEDVLEALPNASGVSFG